MGEARVDGCGFGSEEHGLIGRVTGKATTRKSGGHPSGGDDFRPASKVHLQDVRQVLDATMTALQKPESGGVRGIATGTSFRRLVAKCLARQFRKAVESGVRRIPVCSFHKSRHRLRGARGPVS